MRARLRAGPASARMSESHEAAEAAPGEAGSDPFPFYRDSWVNKALVILFVILPLAAFGFAIWSFWGVGVGAFEIALLVGMWTVTGLAISLGYHRMLSHRAFQARAPTRAALLVLATMSMQGPPADWAATHIRHHAKADREGDPHSPLEGFWHAHFGWLLRDRFVRQGLAHDKIMADPVVRFVQKTWVLWATVGFIVPGILGWLVVGGAAWSLGGLWGFLDGVLWGGLVRVFIGHHITWSVNSLGHMVGTRPFASPDRAKNSLLLALVSWGEGWHNNHHAFPRSAHIGLRWYQVDFGRYTLGLLRLLGQIKSLTRPSRAEREARRARRRKARSPT
jgi:stearoyl-CoA desaturase (Delta-9 desaturase)